MTKIYLDSDPKKPRCEIMEPICHLKNDGIMAWG